MRVRFGKRTVGVGVAAALMLGGGAVATAYAADDRTVVTADATIGMRYLVRQGGCAGNFAVYNGQGLGALGGKTDGGWNSWTAWTPYEDTTECGGVLTGLSTFAGPPVDGAEQVAGPSKYRVGEFRAGAFANGLGATVRTWESQDSRGPGQPVNEAVLILCDPGHSPTLGEDNSIDYDADFCTRYLFYFA